MIPKFLFVAAIRIEQHGQHQNMREAHVSTFTSGRARANALCLLAFPFAKLVYFVGYLTLENHVPSD